MRPALFLAPLLLAACAGEQWGTRGGSALITRTQDRAIVSTQVAGFEPVDPNKPGMRPVPLRITCAEPSPDAIAANTTQLSAALSSNLAGLGGRTNELQAALAVGLAQQLGYVGMRTVTIQAIRDLGFRMCEAYANGLLDGRGFVRLLSGMDGVLLGMHAIDALAGVQRPAAMQLGQTLDSGANVAPRAASAAAEAPRSAAASASLAGAADDVVRVAEALPGTASGAVAAQPGTGGRTTGTAIAARQGGEGTAPDQRAIAAVAAEIRRVVCITVQQNDPRRDDTAAAQAFDRRMQVVRDVCAAPPVTVAATARAR